MNTHQLQAGPHQLSFQRRTLVMGILNVTPDSFSDGGRYNRIDLALKHARQLARDGADILDIGGESTRPGSDPVSLEQEYERVIPVIEKVAKEIDLPISVDTYKAEVAREAVKAGAHIINDVWGAKRDPDMPGTAAELDVPIILMHNRTEAKYRSLMEEVISDLQESVQIVKQAGVKEDKIILDPGIGFAKNVDENLTVMRNLKQIVSLGYPVLLGTSRKSMIGNVLGLPVDQRVEGTAATVAYGIAQGCRIVRVHDVKEMVRVSRMMDAILYGRQK
ncbi:dihydropteroate synthase [Paenactinomyces guangxiensis]|uniref:Dihydropteroate synthase n=1 Tax=Paenactinomyces guangxiensis TaxID=1490290 RepID=A0A7W2AAE2_9BACL|nr:dihydropteroate synthase [Paenactinomyces guangxiensis]MBA4495798.1 dihydropteroate synthase [Paenactinomyces guangxiensis]MBH8592888.1 dihydropteroate synthase [Paenactinomyces guangxiensis]